MEPSAKIFPNLAVLAVNCIDPRGRIKVMKLTETLTGISAKGTDINFIDCSCIDFCSTQHTLKAEKLLFHNDTLKFNYTLSE